MGLDKIIDFILSIIADILPVFVVKQWQKSVILRFGKIHRTRGPGTWFKIPFFDEPTTYEVVLTTIDTNPQTLVTSDGIDVTVSAVIKYNIADVELFTREIYDQSDAVVDITQGHIMREINTQSYEQCRDTTELSHTITKKVRAEVKRYGVYIEQVTLINFIRTRNFRLFRDSLT